LNPPKESIVIRGYRKSDLASCRRLWKELVERHREIYADPAIGGDDPGKFFDEHLKRVGPKRLWVAVDGDEVVGLIGLIVEGEDAEIEPLVVANGSRGRGIGQQLAEQAMAVASATKGVKFLTVRPVARNKEALAFFRAQGLVNIGKVELFADLAHKKWKKGLRIHGLEYRF